MCTVLMEESCSFDLGLTEEQTQDVSTGSLIVASLCRFIETQLDKPPPLHSKDLHSSVVAAYSSIAVWLNAAPMLAECESVLNTVAEAVQLGVTGSKKKEGAPDDCKAASKRVLEAAEYLMYSLFSVVAMYFSCFMISYFNKTSIGCPCVLYIRRSPMQPASAGVAKLRPHPDGYSADQQPPPTPLSSTFDSRGVRETTPSLDLWLLALLSVVYLQPADTTVKPLEAIKETDVIEAELRRIDVETPQQKAIRERNRWTLMSEEDRRVKPAL
ncbi:hypothetical protein TELCIR_04486 [Teladorsagia circumcincta]|uniref:Uncharacterized protein n=1 Tax=Teladorsagia circumcincta TaxID=45464 RepID=A0A2G9UVL7_TELCI|nr:hypothetical protein TELCIR_04486 [Teladorsagia circumcincta]